MTILVFLSFLFLKSAVGNAYLPTRSQYPQVIAHRGASGYIPEHSLQAYQLAIDLGTDYIEPDLCLSKDGVLVVMHDVTLDDTTDVEAHPEFADRYKTQIVEGSSRSGYFIADFTLAELKTLRLHQRLSSRTTLFDGIFTIPTFTEVMDLAWSSYNSTGYLIGIYPELKSPSYHNSLDLFTDPNMTMEKLVLQQLQDHGYDIYPSSKDLKQVNPVVLQCFDPNSLKTLRTLCSLPLILLMNEKKLWNADYLLTTSTFADGVGPDKVFFTDISYEDAVEKLNWAKNVNLFIHPYTFRQEPNYVSTQFKNDPEIEAAYFYCCLKMDGTFTEFPDRMRQMLAAMDADPQAVCTLGGC